MVLLTLPLLYKGVVLVLATDGCKWCCSPVPYLLLLFRPLLASILFATKEKASFCNLHVMQVGEKPMIVWGAMIGYHIGRVFT